MRANVFVGATLWSACMYFGAIGIIIFMTGCSGIELGGTVGLYKVDERSQETKVATKGLPLKCWFTNCEEVNHGS